MKIMGQFEYDSESQTLRLKPDNVNMGSDFSLLIQSDTSTQLGQWQNTPSLSQVRLTFDKQGAGFVCSDITA